ncbi:hypothetical protein CDES_01980 [Corynebacterium deserti GIMN1.010]|uniref:Uncharacterized protein n=1 Tax=Corynebacterium deserti GIMN1.010 TaxID=931089 RepID=A0A0M4CK21_9CORY|nr:hypothetical protein CDES_01980 [Corynebacterium deserti GIMN1.010]
MRSTKALVAQTTRAKPASLGLAIATGGDKTTRTVGVQRLAYELDRETIAVFVNELDHLRRFGSSSDAKKADAAFNNSFVSRSS